MSRSVGDNIFLGVFEPKIIGWERQTGEGERAATALRRVSMSLSGSVHCIEHDVDTPVPGTQQHMPSLTSRDLDTPHTMT